MMPQARRPKILALRSDSEEQMEMSNEEENSLVVTSYGNSSANPHPNPSFIEEDPLKMSNVIDCLMETVMGTEEDIVSKAFTATVIGSETSEMLQKVIQSTSSPSFKHEPRQESPESTTSTINSPQSYFETENVKNCPSTEQILIYIRPRMYPATMFLSKFRNYYEQGKFFDLILYCKDRHFVKLHRIVCAAFSPVLEAMINNSRHHQGIPIYKFTSSSTLASSNNQSCPSNNASVVTESTEASNQQKWIVRIHKFRPTKTPQSNMMNNDTVIYLPQFDIRVLHCVTKCMYSGKVLLNKEMVPHFFEVVSAFQMVGFKSVSSDGKNYVYNINEGSTSNTERKYLIEEEPSHSFSESLLQNLNESEIPSTIPNKQQVINKAPKTTDPSKNMFSVTSGSSKRNALRDISKGFLLKDLAEKYGVTKRQIRRWRYEERRVKLQRRKAYQQSEETKLKGFNNKKPTTGSTTSTTSSSTKSSSHLKRDLSISLSSSSTSTSSSSLTSESDTSSNSATMSDQPPVRKRLKKRA